ncbi:MAG: hypothetical protein KDE35_04710 [Geminicoccaceae bacterium]|nr:hypothetical protein [Geminicoccaceae bacterium]
MSEGASRWNLPLIGGLALLAAAVLYWEYDQVADLGAERAALDRRIEELEKRIETREQLLAEVRFLQNTSPLARLLLQGETAALAGANLQGTVTGIVEHWGGVVRQSQVLRPENADPFVQVGTRVDFVVSMEGLRNILYEIAAHEPSMLIDQLQLAAERGGEGATIGETVQVGMDVVAFSRQLAAEPGGSQSTSPAAGPAAATREPASNGRRTGG